MVVSLILVPQILTEGTATKVMLPPELCPVLCEEQSADSSAHSSLPHSPFSQGYLSRSSGQEQSSCHFYLHLSSSAFPPALLTLPHQAEPQTHPLTLGYSISSHGGCEDVKSCSMFFPGPVPTSSFLKLPQDISQQIWSNYTTYFQLQKLAEVGFRACFRRSSN